MTRELFVLLKQLLLQLEVDLELRRSENSTKESEGSEVLICFTEPVTWLECWCPESMMAYKFL